MAKFNNELGEILPVVGIQHNPTYEWLSVVCRFADYSHRTKYPEPHYGGTKIDAILMTGGEFENPSIGIAIAYNHLRLPNQTTVLWVIELEDGTLWESMTDMVPTSIDPGLPTICNQHWKDDYILSSKAEACTKLVGPHVKNLHFLCRLSDNNLELHESRFTKHNKK